MNKEDCCTKEIKEILVLFEPKIRKTLLQTAVQDREDLAQEMRLKLIEKYRNIQFHKAPKFWDLVNF
ncbi:hypothetical protein NX029_11790 [Cytobacillus firmus]|nr:hypothetical protein [Cytobacillus firmus]